MKTHKNRHKKTEEVHSFILRKILKVRKLQKRTVFKHRFSFSSSKLSYFEPLICQVENRKALVLVGF